MPSLSSPPCLMLLQLCSFLKYTSRGCPGPSSLAAAWFQPSLHRPRVIAGYFLSSCLQDLPPQLVTPWGQLVHSLAPSPPAHASHHPTPSTATQGPLHHWVCAMGPLLSSSGPSLPPTSRMKATAPPGPAQRLALPGAFRTLLGDSELELLMMPTQ